MTATLNIENDEPDLNFNVFVQHCDIQGKIVLLKGKRKIPNHDREKLVKLSALLSDFTTCYVDLNPICKVGTGHAMKVCINSNVSSINQKT